MVIRKQLLLVGLTCSRNTGKIDSVHVTRTAEMRVFDTAHSVGKV